MSADASDRLAEAERDRDHWKAHAEEAGQGFARVCRDYARVAARNVAIRTAVEALHEGTHQCVGGEWWTDDPDYRGSIAQRGTCPTRRAVITDAEVTP